MRVFSATMKGIVGFVALAAAWSAVAVPIRIDVSARPEGAKVLIDGVSKGVVPVSVLDVGEGQHGDNGLRLVGDVLLAVLHNV